jgi:hypothetical protein
MLFPFAVFAQDTPAGNRGINPLSELAELQVNITGDRFDFSRDKGLLVIEGNVVVTFSDFVMRHAGIDLRRRRETPAESIPVREYGLQQQPCGICRRRIPL